jgi:hypothetical protein
MVQLRIGHKLTLALAALLLATVAVAAVGIASLGDVNRRARALYDDNVRTTQATSAVDGGLYEVEESAFRLLLARAGTSRDKLLDEPGDDHAPTVERALVELRQAHSADEPEEAAKVERLAAAWRDFRRLWESGALLAGDQAARQATADRVAAILEPATQLTAQMADLEAEEARQAQVTAEATYRAARSRILLLSAGAVLVWLVIALALVRDLVPRLQAYSRFAARVADGHLGERLAPGGATRSPSWAGPWT